MKKIIAFVLVAVLAFALVSCAGPSQYDEFMAAEVGSTVTVEAYVQGHQSWWDNKLTVYLQDENGGYFAYEMECTEAQASQITVGTKIKVTGKKAEWAGEIEIYNPCTLVEIIEGDTWVAPTTDVTAKMGTEDLINYMNRKVTFKGLEVIAYDDGTETYSMTMTETEEIAPGVELEMTMAFVIVFDDGTLKQNVSLAETNIDDLGLDDATVAMLEASFANMSYEMEGTYEIDGDTITTTVEGYTSTSAYAEGTDDDGEYIIIGEGAMAQKMYKVVPAISYDPDKSDSDIYFRAKDANGNVVEFCVEYYLTNNATATYKAALALEVGDTVDVEGFLYWYNGANPHVTKITVAD